MGSVRLMRISYAQLVYELVLSGIMHNIYIFLGVVYFEYNRKKFQFSVRGSFKKTHI